MSQPNPRFKPTSHAGPTAAAPFVARKFDFANVTGLSERALEIHRSLYEGYVKQTNSLLPLLYENVSAADELSPREQLECDGLVRRFAFERNGMILHELFFDALRGRSDPPQSAAAFIGAVERSFGSYDGWVGNVRKLAQTRGIGWVATVRSGNNDRLANIWIDEHSHGLLADWKPVLMIDLWEHAYLIDFKPTERTAYLTTLLDNIDWRVVDARFA